MQLEPDRLAEMVIRAIEIAVDPMLERIAVAEARLEMKTAEMVPVLAAVTDLTKENAALRERIAVLEARPLVPGPPGDPGPPGQDGKDGAPGLEWKKTYKDEFTYEPGQIVKWGGSTYVCAKTTSGVKPDALPQRTVGPNGAVEYSGVCGKDFWDLFVSKGDPGRAAK